MKALLATLFLLATMAQAQIVTPSGRGSWGDSVRWGDSNDSTSSLRFRGATLARDSSGTWVTTVDSCSLPVNIARGGQYPSGKLEYSYDVRTSSGNTDSSQVKTRVDSRYCLDPRRNLGCESWVQAGRWRGDTTAFVTDSIVSLATTSGTTWKPTRQIFDVPGGSQIRFCVDDFRTGGGTGDTTFFRSHIVRTSSIPAGGIPPASVSLGDIAVENVGITSIAAGDNNIGNVDVVTLPNVTLAAGTNTNEVVGDAAHDAAAAGNPLLEGGYASAAAPSDVSADGDAVRAWRLRNGSAASTLTAAGALIGGDATNGLDVDVTRLPALVASSANIGDVDVLTLPALPAGSNNIGDVDVLTVPTDPFGANADAASATGSISAKLRFIASTGIPVTGTVTVGSHAVTNAGTFATQATATGAAAAGAAASGNPLRDGGVAATSDPTPETAGDIMDPLHSDLGKQVILPYALPGLRWSYAGATGGITNTTAVTAKSAAGANIKNCVTSIQVINQHATVSTETMLVDGAGGTVLHRGWAQAAGGGYAIEFPVPLCGTANTLLEVDNVTTGSAVLYNVQGYTARE